MDEKTQALLTRIADALERMAPPNPPEPDFSAARMFRHDPAAEAFLPAPDYALPLDLLVGVDGQKARFVENLNRFARRLPTNHALLWGVRGTGKSSLAKAAFMAVAATHPGLTLIEVDRDEVAALPPLFDSLRDRPERFVVLCDDASACGSASPRWTRPPTSTPSGPTPRDSDFRPSICRVGRCAGRSCAARAPAV